MKASHTIRKVRNGSRLDGKSFHRATTNGTTSQQLFPKGGRSAHYHSFAWRATNIFTDLVSSKKNNLDAVNSIHYRSSTSSPSAYSSMNDPHPTLFGTNRMNIDAQLRADVRTMGSMLGKIIAEHSGNEMLDKIERLRTLSKAWRKVGDARKNSSSNNKARVTADKEFASISSFVSSLSNQELLIISRAFTHFCAIANAAENHHRSRKNEEMLRESVRLVNTTAETAKGKSIEMPSPVCALGTQPDSCGSIIPALLKEPYNLTPEEVHETLLNQKVEIVLTAHPTEVNRRTLLDKHHRIQLLLTEADNQRRHGDCTPYQKKLLDESLEREISLIWQSDELARSKPTVQTEAEMGTLVIENVMWKALPQYLRKLNATMISELGGTQFSLPLDATPFQISSWMGGDRDGNPNVTPTVTREVCYTNRYRAAKLLTKDLEDIYSRLSTTYCSADFRSAISDRDAREPYRAFLEPIIAKLKLTSAWAKQELHNAQSSCDDKHAPTAAIRADDVYTSKAQLMDELLMVHRSLCDTGNELTANGRVADLIRNLWSFGLSLIPLDVRQESDRHTEALDAITRYLGQGSYQQWDESTRMSWLQKELSSSRPLVRPGEWHDHPDIFNSTTVDTLETMQMIAEQHEESLGAYVISQATHPSDVLAVLLLQRDAGVKSPLRVVPLFETLDDLEGAADTMDTLFSLPVYRGSIEGKQEVMIGYSDSAKDAGRLAACWSQYEKQEELAIVASKYSIELTFFHGKGGSVGRGGNPATFNAILSHAPDTINGRFRVTEQGEMISQNFGHFDRCERTLDIYTAAVCAEQHTVRTKPTEEWREMMNRLSETSCRAYRDIVRGDERFVPYFRAATPEMELADLNIGSRPAKRKASGGVESLRAIPWIFAWTQTRSMLPTWLGVGEAISEVLQSDDADKLRIMYRDWDSFRTTIDLVEMVLSKSEPSITEHYENMLVSDSESKALGVEVRRKHEVTEQAVLELTGHKELSESNELLKRLLKVRNPYVDCLNMLQVETLKRLRGVIGDETIEPVTCDNNEKDEKELLKDTLLITITGIANGMGNTG